MQSGKTILKPQDDKASIGRVLNKINAEIKRLGNIRALPPVAIKADAGGYTIALQDRSPILFGQLQSRLNANSRVDCKLYRRKLDDTGWELSPESTDIIKVWSSPLWGTNDYLNDGTKVMVQWLANYNRYVVVNAQCST
jgi:hypothetical protein